MRRFLMSDSGVDVKALPGADMFLEFDRLAERFRSESLRSAVIERLCFIQAPEAHRARRVDARGLLQSASRFIVPVIVEQVQSLVEPDLSFPVPR